MAASAAGRLSGGPASQPKPLGISLVHASSGILHNSPTNIMLSCFFNLHTLLSSSLHSAMCVPQETGEPGGRGPLATRAISIYSFRQLDVQEALARIEGLHLRGMYGSTGAWRRLLQKINADFHAVEYLGESELFSLVSAVSAYMRFTACPSPEAHLLAANVLQTLAANPTAAARAAARAAVSCSDGTRLRLLLLLQPLIATHPDKSSLCALKAEAFEPLRGPCIHALQAAASAANNQLEPAAATAAGATVAAAAATTTTAARATTAAARDASLLSAVSGDAFGVLHLLLESIEARGPLENQHTLLGALADAAGALLPLVEEENATRAAFVCSHLLLMKGQTSQTDNLSGRQQQHINQCISQPLPDAYTSSLNSSSSTDSSSSLSSSNSSNSSSGDFVSLDLLILRCLLRAPLPTASAAQIEEASAALWMMRKRHVCGRKRKPLMLTAEEGEAAREAQEQTADMHAAATLSLLAAAETHVRQAAAGRAASLEPKEVLQVVTAVSNCTTAAMCSNSSSSSSSMCCSSSSSSSSTRCSSSNSKRRRS
ncbi:hypothetical protein Emag_007540 [Eimeria magna]